MSIEEVFFLFLNSFTGKWFLFDSLIYFLAQVLPFLLVLSLVYFLIRDWKGYVWILGGSFLAGIFARYALVELIRWFTPRLRPFQVFAEEVNLILPYKDSLSFPSGHTAFVFAISTVVYLANKKMGVVFYCLSFLVGFSRVFAGMHWPLDIVVGAFIGILAGILLQIVMELIKKKR